MREQFIPGFSCEYVIPQLMDLAHWHQDLQLVLVQSGAVIYWMSGRRLRVRASQVVIFWAGLPHQVIESEPNTAYHLVTVPLTSIRRWQIPVDIVSALMRGKVVVQPADPGLTDAKLCTRWQCDLCSNSPANLLSAELELIAWITRLCAADNRRQGGWLGPASAAGTPVPSDGKARFPNQYMPMFHRAARASFTVVGAISDTPKSRVQLMVAYIAAHYTERLDIADVAAVAKIHPNYATSLLRREYGKTIHESIEECRLAHAKRLLVTTNQSGTDIALDSGFWSTSRFYAAFRRACGCTPEEYRHRSNQPASAPTKQGSSHNGGAAPKSLAEFS